MRLSWIPICSTDNFASKILYIVRFSKTESENIFYIGIEHSVFSRNLNQIE